MRIKRLRNKVLLLTIGLIVLLGISITVFVKTTLTQKLSAELQEKGGIQAVHLTGKVAEYMLSGNNLIIQMLINNYKKTDREIEYIYIQDREGTVIAHTFQNGFPTDLIQKNIVNFEVPYHIHYFDTGDGLITNIDVPILDGKGGYLSIGFSQEYLVKDVNSVIAMITGIILAVSSLGILITFVFSRKITKPLADLAESAKKVGRGGLEKFIVVNTNDEIKELANALNSMTGDLSKTVVSRNYFDSILESMGDSVVVVDSDHIIKSVNHATLHLLGYRKEEVVGNPFSTLLEEDADPVYRGCFDEELTSQGRFDNHETNYKTKGGNRIPVMLSASTIENNESSRSSMVFAAKDIRDRKRIEADLLKEKYKTEQKVEERTAELKSTVDLLREEVENRRFAEASLKKAKDAAVSANNSKSQFLANMSHEIRTPMNGVIGMTELALKTDDPEKKKKFLLTVRKSADSLLRLINDILDFSKVEADKMELEEIEFDLNEIIENVITLSAPDEIGKDFALRYYPDADLPAKIKGDPYRLRQVIVNLLGNAVKFTEEGQIAVRVESRTLDEESEDVILHVSVSDTGIGIAEDKLEDIFESFTQADGSSTRKYGGTGLGLAISRRIVNEMGGDIWVESELGKGSIFHFTVKFGIVPETEKQGLLAVLGGIEGGQPVQVETKDIHVLLAEDNLVNQEVGVLVMEEEGYCVDVVSNGREAIDILKRERFDVVLMDMQMPELDGIEATKIIRSSVNSGFDPAIPIIALTAHAFKENKEKCLESGMNSFITKPFRIEDINREIRNVLVMKHCSETERGGNSSSLDREDMLQRVGGKERILEKIWRVFRDDAPLQIETLKKALDAEDTELVERQAHSLKSAASNIGAKIMSGKASELEQALKENNENNVHLLCKGLETEFVKVMDELNDQLGHDNVLTQEV